jgi:hypothetical protein
VGLTDFAAVEGGSMIEVRSKGGTTRSTLRSNRLDRSCAQPQFWMIRRVPLLEPESGDARDDGKED